MKRFVHIGLLTAIFVACLGLPSVAQTAKKPAKPTELVIWKFETLIMSGSLLSRQGWTKAATLFQRPVPYPSDGPITIMWTPRYIGEDWVRGKQAQVESKWIDYYGTIDANLQFHPAEVDCPMVEIYSLAYTDTRLDVEAAGTARETKGTMEWKIASPRDRAATIEQVIAYLTLRRDRTRNLVMKRNAAKSIGSLRKLVQTLKRGRGASAC